MRTAGHRPQDNLAPALAGAAALHLALLAILLFRPAPPMTFGAAVPITLVAHAPTTDSRPAVQAPTVQTAQAQNPVPAAKAPEPPPPPPPTPPRPQPRAVETPSPPPRPAPAKTAVKPQPKPAPTPAPTPPAPARSRPAPQTDSFNLDSLQADINKSMKAAKPHPSSAPRGPATRPETALAARVDAGHGVAQSDVAGLSQLLTRLWNVNCGLEETVVVPVSFKVGDDGRLDGAVSAHGLESSHDPAVSVAARRAIDAVHKAAPYGAPFRNNSFTVNFDAKKACASG